jgi:putative salt-induced outer membrane protein YdiY
MRIAIATIAALLMLVPATLAKRKDDVVVMKNGDRFTGEIKRLEEGKLIFSASYMASDVVLDWTKVERLESKDEFNVYLTSGGVHTGVIQKTSATDDAVRSFTIQAGNSDVQVHRDEVIVVRPIEDTAWKQLTGSIDYGYNFTGGPNATTQSSLSGAMAYRVERWSMELNGSSVFNGQSEGATTGRNTFSLLSSRKLSDRWYTGTLAELLNSQQQDLTLRATLGGGLGRVLLRSERTSLRLLSGMLFNRERYSSNADGAPQANNAEALFYMQYAMYRFKKFDLDAVLYAYPSLTNHGRIRTGLQTALGIELFRNFKWKFSLYENFDSRPPVNAPKNDFGTGTSVGWTF